jgi:glutaminyl-peptide cyclotransferase
MTVVYVKKFLGLVCLSLSVIAPALAFEVEQDATSFSVDKIDQAMKRFVKAPHPMASMEQRKYTQELKAALGKEGWDTQIQKFKTKIPNTAAERLGGKDKKASAIKEVEGENIIALSKGSDRCLILIGGHYDTKPYANMRFVGANDGGSSTAAMLELARVVSAIRKSETKDRAANIEGGRFLDCTLGLAFFDGEEATLADWNDGERLLGVQDNIHGSRAFAASLEKQFDGIAYKGLPIKALLIIDMIGHKDQSLFITQGSNPQLAQKLLSQKGTTKLVAVNLMIEDDHLPFAQLGIPFVHIIDWTNISEWHTANDTLDIISNKKIADFGDLLVRFLKQKR